MIQFHIHDVDMVATGIRIIVNHAEILRVEILMGGGKGRIMELTTKILRSQSIEYMIKAAERSLIAAIPWKTSHMKITTKK
jgi:hypothetical protein